MKINKQRLQIAMANACLNMDDLAALAGISRVSLTKYVLFNYILTLTSNDFSVDDTRECIRILNRFVLKEPLSDDELEGRWNC